MRARCSTSAALYSWTVGPRCTPAARRTHDCRCGQRAAPSTRSSWACARTGLLFRLARLKRRHSGEETGTRQILQPRLQLKKHARQAIHLGAPTQTLPRWMVAYAIASSSTPQTVRRQCQTCNKQRPHQWPPTTQHHHRWRQPRLEWPKKHCSTTPSDCPTTEKCYQCRLRQWEPCYWL